MLRARRLSLRSPKVVALSFGDPACGAMRNATQSLCCDTLIIPPLFVSFAILESDHWGLKGCGAFLGLARVHQLALSAGGRTVGGHSLTRCEERRSHNQEPSNDCSSNAKSGRYRRKGDTTTGIPYELSEVGLSGRGKAGSRPSWKLACVLAN